MNNDPEKDPIVEKKIGNKILQMQESHKLPEYFENYPFYDRALPRISKKVEGIDGYLNLIDIGANIGDTISLITDKVDGSFLCVEGDENYLPFLKINLGDLKNSKVFIEESYCGQSENLDKNLKIKRENGTARLEKGNEIGIQTPINFKSLDSIIKKYPLFERTNILKIDTDGFEINVLKSGKNFIKETSPIIYFEFDPEFYSITNENPMYVFEFLLENGYEEALFYDNYGIPVKIINISNKVGILELVNCIDKKSIYYYDVLVIPASKREFYYKIFESELLESLSLFNDLLNTTKNELISLKSKFELVNSNLDSTILDLYSRVKQIELIKLEKLEIKEQLSKIEDELEKSKKESNQFIEELSNVYSSRGWKAVLFLRKLVRYVIPREDIRRKIIIILYNLSKYVVKSVLFIKNKILVLFYNFKNSLLKLKPRRSVKINLNSNKIVFIDHSFHEKTKSSLFIIDYLKEFFDVKVIQDDSWQGKPFSNLDFIDESYLGIIFWQSLPDYHDFNKINHNNIVYFPMYDQSGRLGLEYWSNYRNLKIVNFSKTFNDKFIKWGYDSMYIQYFPKPESFMPGDNKEVFFWQRLNYFNINSIINLFKKGYYKIHIHKAVDPGQIFVKPDVISEKDYQITYSNWFKNKEDLRNIIKQKGIYIAPREYEGIGMSFLEAMAMGKAVVSINNPTMNEYIKNGENGYLFSLSNIKEIDFTNVEQIQKNCYKFMVDGYANWEKEKQKIIKFILRE